MSSKLKYKPGDLVQVIVKDGRRITGRIHTHTIPNDLKDRFDYVVFYSHTIFFKNQPATVGLFKEKDVFLLELTNQNYEYLLRDFDL